MSEASGVAKISGAVLGELGAIVDAPVAEASQLDLVDLSGSEDHLPLPDASEICAIQMEMGCDAHMAVAEHRRRAGKGGRKPGARNRRSNDFEAYILQFGAHPGVGLIRMAARPVEVLAAELGCSKLEAAALQVRCNAELLPYMASKLAAKVPNGQLGDMTLIMQTAGGEAVYMTLPGDAAPPQMSFAEIQPDQPLSANAPGQSE